MRILYIFRSLAHWGGIERILIDKMNYLSSVYGDDVFILTTDQGAHPIPYKLNPEVNIEDLNIRFHLQYQYRGIRRFVVAWKMERMLKHKIRERLPIIRPDIIICTTTNYVDLNVLVKVKGNIPLIVESHSVYQKTLFNGGLKRQYANYMFRRGFNHASTIVSLTERDALDWCKIHHNVKVIPNVVNLNKERVSTLDNKRVIWVGRYESQKRPLEMIEIWKSVYPKYPDWHLEMYGEGELRPLLEETVASIEMNIHITPPTNSIFECYRNSSILVSTSLFEPFGLVIPEAMSCGLPTVAYDCSFGPASIIENGVNGFLVKMDDRETMIKSICMLMNDKSLRKKMGEAAIESVSKYSATIIMPLWKELFRSLLTK